MKRPRKAPSSVLIFLFLLCAVALPSGHTLADGTQTGIITGVVADLEDAPVQGVTVTLEGPRAIRTAVTDASGRFRFQALEIGTYRLTAELLGLEATPREVEVSVDKTSSVSLQLRPADAEAPAPVEETIQVVATAPVIDRFETRVGTGVDFEFLDKLPVERFYQSVALLLPGVSGGEDGNPNVSGALREANLYLVDGVDTTDPTTGLFGLNLTYEAIDEVDVTTAAAPIEYGRATGAFINVVTRSGGRDYEGRARLIATNNDWNDDYDFAPEVARHLTPEINAANAGPDDLDPAFAVDIGGPLAPDRLFFFAAWENFERSFLRPTALGELWDEANDGESGAFKLTAQPTPAQTIVAQHTFDEAEFAAFAPFDLRPAENSLPQISPGDLSNSLVESRPGDVFALEERRQDGRFTKLGWNWIAGQNLSLSLDLAEQERELERAPRNSRGLTGDAPHIAVIGSFDDMGELENESFFLVNGITQEGFERRPRDQASLSVDAFVDTGGVEHELRFGVDYQRTDSITRLEPAGTPGRDPETGRPVAGQLFIDLDARPQCVFEGRCQAFDPATGDFQPLSLLNFYLRPERRTREENSALFVSDTIAFDRFVFRFGLRFERLEAESLAGGGGGPLIDDEDLAPRLALTYDPLGDGEVLLTAAWGRYYEPVLQGAVDAFRLARPLSGFTQYQWGIFEGIDCTGENPANLESRCWRPSETVPFLPVQLAGGTPGLERASVDEFVVGFERRFGPLTGLSVHYVDRRWRDLWDDVLFVDGVGTGEEELGAVLINIDEAERRYEGVQVLLRRRFADGWELLASYTWSEVEGNLFSADGLDDFADFFNVTDTNLVNRLGPAPYDRPQVLGVFGSYRLPFERVDLTLASAVRYRDGVPFQRERLEEAGVRFLEPRGAERLPGSFQWDLSFFLGWPLTGDLELEVKGEVFNLTGESEVLGVETVIDTGLFGRPRTLGDLQNPRSYRLTLGLRF